MDVTKFTEAKTGQLMPVSLPAPDHAFIPDPLPPKWSFDAKLWPLLSDAKLYLGMLEGAARILPNPELFLKPLQRVESLTSSRLEGTFATAQELMLFEMNPKLGARTEEANAWREVSNHTNALIQGCRELDKLPFCIRLLKDLHRTLLRDVRGSTTNPGTFRKHQVHLGSNRRYVPPPHQDAEKAMHEWENYCNQDDSRFDPLIRCFLTHYQLEAIHPFGDGNGRIGRVVLSLMIYKWCNLEMPWLYLSPYFERYKDEYIDYLFNISATGEWGKWLEFCLRGVIQQAKKAVDQCRDLQTLREDMHKRTASDGNARIHAIIEGLFERPILRITELAKTHKVTYPTAKSDVSYLADKGILADLPDSKVRTFYAPEIFTLAYGEYAEVA